MIPTTDRHKTSARLTESKAPNQREMADALLCTQLWRTSDPRGETGVFGTSDTDGRQAQNVSGDPINSGETDQNKDTESKRIG